MSEPTTMAEAEAELARLWAAGDASGAERVCRWVDAHDPAREAVTASLGGSALWYAKKGLRVFPLRPGGKQPRPGSHGCKDASSDPAQVSRWWGETPEANIGIATGYLVDVIDVDGPVGNESLTRLLGEHPDLLGSRLGHVLTPRPGGRHFYVPTDGALGNGASLARGIDYRGAGGYVVAPPSRTEVGVYRWVGAPSL